MKKLLVVFSKKTFYCDESRQIINITDSNEYYEIITRNEGETQYKPNKVVIVYF
jgi:hypothetical protein